MPEQPAATQPETLVSVGIPVRNGATTLRAALDSVLRQKHRRIEVIISDNASEDDTATLCQEYAQADPRVHYFRQSTPLRGWQNFQFAFEQSTGDYFMWAAHDDVRDPDYVGTLLRGHRRNPSASLVFSDLVVFAPPASPQDFPIEPYEFSTAGLSRREALRRLYRRRRYYEIYGLFRSAALRNYNWAQSGFGEDLLFLTWVLLTGDAVYEPGSRFYYAKHLQSRQQHIARHSLKAPPAFQVEQLVWQGAGIATAETHTVIRLPCRVACFIDFHWQWHHQVRARKPSSRLSNWVRNFLRAALQRLRASRAR
ncbi:MAG: glycosyltransferase family A protein [Pseudomonadota bacterium]